MTSRIREFSKNGKSSYDKKILLGYEGNNQCEDI